MVNLLLPKRKILEDDNNTLGIWLSGGADSSLLCYMLAKYITENNLNYYLQTVTIPKRPSDTHHLRVLSFIKDTLDAHHIFKDPIVYQTSREEYHDSFSKINVEHVIQKKYNFIYSGINQTPGKENYNITWKQFDDLEKMRSDDAAKLLAVNVVIEHEGTLYELGDIRPFFNLTKKDIAQMYKDLNLLDTLFPLTNSCNDLDTVNGHCGKCWFCNERIWAFGKLN